MNALNNFIDLCFVADIIVCLRTTFYDTDTGDEVFDGKRTSMNYIRSSRFFIDVVSTVPLDTIGFLITQKETPALQVFSLLKLVRITRITAIIGRLNTTSQTKNILKLGQLVLTVLVYLHLSGCLWFLLVAKDQNWVPPLNDRQPEGLFYDETDFWHQYTTSLYHSVILFIGKDIRPVGASQLLFVSGVLLIGSLLNANIFGNIALIILDLKFKTIQE